MLKCLASDGTEGIRHQAAEFERQGLKVSLFCFRPIDDEELEQF